ncbi:hypothetical protein CVT24_007365 [Panaeolus cyanescens]|uniref:BTB domain-containing protein n=1 Tax=Panaeolus cyanescens TaxID=181874 RepID=A0A409YL49_9AGAR|nr:hypothetical protein CVT24_007365 [Panaeolus cyanescens]
MDTCPNDSNAHIDVDAVIANTAPVGSTIEPEIDDEFDAKIVVFKVENTIFSVLQGALMCPGSFFETMFSLPLPSSEDLSKEGCPQDSFTIEGTSKDNPIVLENVSKADFRSFLRQLFPLEGFIKCKSDEEFFAALRLATMWDFRKLRAQIIDMLTPEMKNHNFVDLILLAKKHGVKSWLQHGYETAIRDKNPLSVFDMYKAGVDLITISKLVTLRDSWLYRASLERELRCMPSLQQDCSSHEHLALNRCMNCSYRYAIPSAAGLEPESSHNGMPKNRATQLVLAHFNTELSAMLDDQ